MKQDLQHPCTSSDRPRHFERAIELASELAGPHRGGKSGIDWSVRAAHVGDLSVLALALAD